MTTLAATNVRRNLTDADLLGFLHSIHAWMQGFFEFTELMFSSLKEEKNLSTCENLETTALWKDKNYVIYLILARRSHIFLLNTSRINSRLELIWIEDESYLCVVQVQYVEPQEDHNFLWPLST